MKRSISTALIAGALAIGGVACERTESGLEGAGQDIEESARNTGDTLERGAEDLDQDAREAGDDTRQAFRGMEDDAEERRYEEEAQR